MSVRASVFALIACGAVFIASVCGFALYGGVWAAATILWGFNTLMWGWIVWEDFNAHK